MQTTKSVSAIIRVAQLPSRWMHRLYDWTIQWGTTKYAKLSLFVLAFAESSFFPVPPDVLLIAVTVADRYKWWLLASITTVGSVLGAVFGYYIGMSVFETIGRPIVAFYQLESYFEIVRLKYDQNAFLAIVTAAFTPIPFKVFTIAGGVFQIPLSSLILASIIGRAGRFFLVALLLRIFGQKIADSIEKHFNMFSLVFAVLLIGGFLVVKFI